MFFDCACQSGDYYFIETGWLKGLAVFQLTVSFGPRLMIGGVLPSSQVALDRVHPAGMEVSLIV